MFAYSHYYLDHASEVILIYPYQKNKFEDEICFEFNVQNKQAFLRVVPFNLDRPQNIIEFISPQGPYATTELLIFCADLKSSTIAAQR